MKIQEKGRNRRWARSPRKQITWETKYEWEDEGNEEEDGREGGSSS